MRGTVRKITLPRRLVADLMHASMRVPFVSLARPLNVRSLLEARAQGTQRPGWAAIFVKAFALVAKEEPILRTLYVKWPGPCLLRTAAQRRHGGDSAASKTARIACCRKRSPPRMNCR